MFKRIKQLLPRPVKTILVKIKIVTINKYKKKQLLKKILIKHHKLLQEVQAKEKIRVVFLAIHESVWKVDTVFKRMLDDPYFEPEILVCPYIAYGEKRMIEDMDQAYSYFANKNYPVTKARQSDGSWLKIEEFTPDLIFFTNPHNITRPEYYEQVYLNYLSCYLPYFFLTTTHGEDQSIYNQDFHNAMWKIFMPHSYSMKRATEVSCNKAQNCLFTGYPSCEGLINANGTYKNVWKKQGTLKKRIIFSPHHTIFSGQLELSNFLLISNNIKVLVGKYKDQIQWAFKPHPMLKSNLYLHHEWGKERTNKYYLFWNECENTQLEEGDYVDLFVNSDAIIHDCGSFIAEYLFVKKPCAYLQLNGNTQLDSINDFGKLALKSYFKINSLEDIEVFIKKVIDDNDNITVDHFDFIKGYIEPLYMNDVPSSKIIRYIKNHINIEGFIK